MQGLAMASGSSIVIRRVGTTLGGDPQPQRWKSRSGYPRDLVNAGARSSSSNGPRAAIAR